MGTVKLGENMEIKVEVIKKACSMAMKAHKYPEKQYLFDKIKSSSPEVVFSFAGSLSVNDWFAAGGSFGDMEVDRRLFPSLKYVGLDEIGRVNEAFFKRFKAVLANPKFEVEVKKAVVDRRKVVFTGHSSGGAIAILATVWFLEVNSRLPNFIEPLCLTFGSPLVGDRIINIALRREKWSRCFVNFVMRLDIVPRISLSPLSSIGHQLQRVLDYFNQNPQQPPADAPDFYETVVRNASSVANYAACKIMGSTNPLLETASSFIELSPYRPLGTYVFCTGTGKLVEISNADAVLQVLFYSSQLSTEEEKVTVAQTSLRDHLNYENYLKECLRTPIVTSLFHLHQEAASPVTSTANVDMDLNDLGLSERASLCLRAADALERQKLRNQNTIDGKQIDIEKCLGNLESYKSTCAHKAGYYDAFKSSDQKEDFHANVNRLELAGIWDEIIEMLKRHELPDEFEGQEKWIRLGTRYRRIVEPLDIANYYRHLKNEDTGHYMGKGRPRRYKCTQKWREHAEKLPDEFPGSCFWAEVEELLIQSGSQGTRESILQLKTKVEKWIVEKEVGDDVRLENSTFMKLQRQHGLAS